MRDFRRQQSWIQAAALSAGLLVAGVASAQVYTPTQWAANQRPQLERICVEVMGTPPQDERFRACADTLASALVRLNASRAVEQGHKECLAKGLAIDSAAWNGCVLMRAEKYQALPLPGTGGPETPAAAPRTWTQPAPDEFARRAQLACASLGYRAEDHGQHRCAGELRRSFSALEGIGEP